MQKYILSIFLLTIFTYNIDTAKASILDNTFIKIKSIFGVEKIFAADIKVDTNQDFALKVNYKTLSVLDDKDASNTNVASYNVNKYSDNKEDIFLEAEVGPMRTSTDEELIDGDNIQVYEVKKGDTLSQIAKIYNVSKNTIAWANDIKDGKAKEGDILVILPISGVKHTIKKGDTLKTLAKKYNADISDISEFNNIKEDSVLSLGGDIIIPDGKMSFDAPAIAKKTETKKQTKKIYASAGAGYFVRPIIGGIRTQGIHGQNAVDIASPVGTPILAAAGGSVLVAKSSGYNGGYGKLIIISHGNGTQTVYAHMNNVYVSNGQTVSAGEQIGESGNSGKSTGPHLHFEIRGAENPF